MPITEEQIKKAEATAQKQIDYWQDRKERSFENAAKEAKQCTYRINLIKKYRDEWIARLNNKKLCTWHSLTAKAKMYVVGLNK